MHQPANAAKFAAATIANPLGARQESSRQGGPIDIVTAVRRFSESLLSSRVTRDVKQEVKALAAQMEILATRRHVAARRAKSPSAAETRVALRNLKRFLEREANRELARKRTSASCTTDTLESSSSHAQAFSPTSEITRDYEFCAIAACGSRGDTQLNDSHKPPPPYQLSHGGIQRVRAQTPEVGKPELTNPTSTVRSSSTITCQKQQQQKSHRPRRLASRRKPRQSRASGAAAAQLIRLTCADRFHLLLLPVEAAAAAAAEAADNPHPDVHAVAYIPTETAAELELLAAAAVAVVVAIVTNQQHVEHCLHSRSPARTERVPVVAFNSQLEAAAPSRLEVAVEKTLDLVVITADPSGGGGRQNNDDDDDDQTVQCRCRRCFCWHSIEAARISDVGETAWQLRDKALVAEQGNFNCATGVSTRLSIVNDWAKTGSAALKASAAFDHIVIATLKTSNSELAWNESQAINQVCSQVKHQVSNQVSTCSYPSDSDGLRRPSSDAEWRRPPSDSTKMKDTEESVDLQSSSALIQQQQQHQAEPARLEHVNIAASAVRLEQRVCESCSPEVLASSTSVLTVSDPPDWQQLIFGIVDLVQLTRLAERLERSDSPTDAPLEVTVRRRGGPREARGGGGCGDSNSERSKSTLDVVDQSGTTEAAAAMLAGCSAAVAGGLTSTLTTNPAGALGGGCGGAITTWSSCELGQSSGFTKLLLTLDKAARRRREQMRARRRNQQSRPPPPPPPLTDVVASGVKAAASAAAAARGRRISRSRNNSAGRRPPRPRPPQPPPLALATVDAAEVILRQEEALKLAARSLTELADSLQQCMRRVHSAAEAIKL